MTSPGPNPDLFKWKGHNKNKTSTEKVQKKNSDIDQWRKRVEQASEFAVSEVFFPKKANSGIDSRAVPLESCEQLRDHDEAYKEAQALLRDWLNTNLQLETDEEHDLRSSTEGKESAAVIFSQLTAQSYDNFDDLYSSLAGKDIHGTVDNVIQDLLGHELLDSGMMEELALDVGKTMKKFTDPRITMEARHQLVRENRALHDAERLRQHREREARRAAREEAKRLEQEEEKRRNQDARRQEEMVHQEVVRLRRQMEEQKCQKQLARQRENERKEKQRSTRDLQSTPTPPPSQQQRDAERLHKEEKIQTMVHTRGLKMHFYGWYMVVLDRRLRMGKATALSNWKRQLRVWRAWRTFAWEEQQQREAMGTEEELRTECRQSQLAVKNDRQRLMQYCFNEWHRWCWSQKRRREILSRQDETHRKMAELISAVSSGKLQAAETPAARPMVPSPKTATAPETTEEDEIHRRMAELISAASSGKLQTAETPAVQPKMPSPKTAIEPEATEEGVEQSSGTVTPDASTIEKVKSPVANVASQPTEPWQVTRRHVTPTPAELRDALQKSKDGAATRQKAAPSPGGRFENRHAAQQQIIAQQRKLLKEQHDELARLKVEHSAKKNAQLLKSAEQQGMAPKRGDAEGTEQRTEEDTTVPDVQWTNQKKPAKPSTPHPAITAMEARARQRTDRKKEIEELKRKKEQQKLAELREAEEHRVKEELEEKRQAAKKRKEERRLEREREEQKRKEMKRLQWCLKLACHHHNRSLLLWRGLAPWKRLIVLRDANTQLAESHYSRSLLRRCTRVWLRSKREAVSLREASADQQYQRTLLWRSFSCWKRLMDWRRRQEEQAEEFYREHSQRRFLLALQDHVTRERLLQVDQQEVALEHNNRRVQWRCLAAWRQLPGVQRQERERDERRKKLGRTVSKVLPDFCLGPQS